MDDPNVTYKRAFAELRESLGRVPTSNELLPLHDAYKGAFLSLPSEVEHADKEYALKQLERAREAAAGPPQRLTVAAAAPLSGPRIIAEGEQAESVLTPYPASPALCQGRQAGGRGPGGGVMAVCVGCGREWERPARRGRPAARCESCRG